MSYATLMVNVELGRSNAGLLRFAGDLAPRFEAGLIGIAACSPMPMPMIYGDGYVDGALIAQACRDFERQVKQAEAEFRSLLEMNVEPLEWRSTAMSASLWDNLRHEARSADLIVTGASSNESFVSAQSMSVSDLVMQAGRPVLVVPAKLERLQLEQVLVAWKDGREARRAIADALPILKLAGHIGVVEIAAESDIKAAQAHVADVAVWLKRHGIAAEAIAVLASGTEAKQLEAIAHERGAGLIVAGAYGHSRFREWVLGGVTRDLLSHSDGALLLSH